MVANEFSLNTGKKAITCEVISGFGVAVDERAVDVISIEKSGAKRGWQVILQIDPGEIPR